MLKTTLLAGILLMVVMTVASQNPSAVENKNQKIQDATRNVVFEFARALTLPELESRSVPGQIKSISILSLTSNRNGVIYSTTNSPIQSLSQGLREFGSLVGYSSDIFAIRSFTITGSDTEISDATAVVPDASVKSLPKTADADEKTTKEKDLSGAPTLESSAATPQASLAYIPSKAVLSIQTLSNTDRRIDVSFSWDNSDQLSGLSASNATLEVQVNFTNHATKPSANTVTYVSGKVKIFAAENFQNAYLDTTALNSLGVGGTPTETELTFGSYKASSDFRPGIQYHAYFIAERGALDADFAKLSVQRGIYKPSITENAGVYAYCKLYGDSDPANCVAGVQTDFLTPRNSLGTAFSIIAPTATTFSYPNAACSIPAGYPDLPNLGLNSSPFIDEGQSKTLAPKMLAIVNAYGANGGKTQVGCGSNMLHLDSAWWPAGGLTQDFDGGGAGKGAILEVPAAARAYYVHGGIWTRYVAIGGPRSVVGEPGSDEKSVTSSKGSIGAYQSFLNGFLYWNSSSNKVYFVKGAIADKYRTLGQHADGLGFPVSDEYAWNGGARSDFEGGYIFWTATAGSSVVRYLPPTVGTYSLSPLQPRASQPFDVSPLNGTNFMAGSTDVFFCVSGTNSCHQQPASLVSVKSITALTITNINLGVGAWQIYVRTPGGTSSRSAAFSVTAAVPTIGSYSFSPSPKAGQNFTLSVSGTNLVVGGTSIYFCLSGSSTCYLHPQAGTTVTNANSLAAKDINLAAGTWQFYLTTAGGSSARSTSFTVQIGPPTIAGFSWSPTPTGTNPFGGTITGTNFVPGGTSVVFCVAGSSTCYQQGSSGVSVANSSRLDVSNVRLSKGNWQVYVQTSSGASSRSATFTVK